MRYAFRIFGSIMISVIISACSTKTCYDDIDPLVNIGLFASGTGAVKKSTSLKVTGATSPSPTELVTATSVSCFSVPLGPMQETAIVYISLNGVADTAQINYTNYPHLVSPECGYTIFSDITGLNTTHNIIDSLIIENKSVTLDGERNLRLFY